MSQLTKEDVIQLFKDRLRIQVEVSSDTSFYDDSSEKIRVKVALLLDDEAISEDECSATLPKKDKCPHE